MTTVEEVHLPIRRLPLRPTLREAFLFVWHHRWHFGRLLIIPLALTILLGVVAFLWTKSQGTPAVAGYVTILCILIIFTFFAVSCHRMVLLGEHSVSRWGIPHWTNRETRFFLLLVALLCIALLGAIPTVVMLGLVGYFLMPFVSLLAYVPGIFLGACIVYVLARLSLSLPAAAVDHPQTIEAAWLLSRGNGWRLVVLSLVPEGLMGLGNWLTGGSGVKFRDGVYSVAIFGFRMFCALIAVMILAAILSISFRKLSNWQSAPPP